MIRFSEKRERAMSHPAFDFFEEERINQVILDQFYTKPKIALDCVNFFHKRALKFLEEPAYFVEPSAGAGDFMSVLPKGTIGFDLEPRAPKIKKQDFFDYFGPKKPSEQVVVIGNPPFGKRGKLALDFCRQASEFADTIAFIVPMCFTNYGIQKHMPLGYRLIGEKELNHHSFYMQDGKSYNVGAVFQIWTKLPNRLKDMRIYAPPPISHPDFDIHQYNNTRQAEYVFGLPFDLAVPCQGYQDYTRKENNPDNCERNKQWMLFSFAEKRAKRIIEKIDFPHLAHRRITTIPGYNGTF